MSDQVDATLPGQGVGTPAEPNSSSEQSQSAAKTGQEQASQAEDGSKPLTRAEFLAYQEDQRRQIQGIRDSNKAVRARMTEIDSAVKTLRASGTEITDEQVKAMKQKAAAEVLIEPEQAEVPDSGKPDPLDMSAWDKADPATLKVMQLQLDHGEEIVSTDPEAKIVEIGKGRIAFIRSYEAALKAKTARQSASTTETKPSAPPAARIPASGSTSGPVNQTGRQLLEHAHK